MCGVVALAGWSEHFIAQVCEGSVDAICRRMTAALAHRGNNGEGFFTSSDYQCLFGHRRLSIFDTSPRGNQPMSTADGRYTITFNGEIYNFKELRHELASLGIHFISESDTEVLLYGYAVWGPAVLERLRGMFAGVIWDSQEQKLFAFRDHVGIKPLYWWQDEHQIALASELRALLKHPHISKKIRKNAVAQYFRFGSIHAPETIFESVYALQPGHYLIATAEHITTTQYWHPSMLATRTEVDVKALAGQVQNALRDSIALHMRSDIPVGAFLSGGLDSGAIVALMKEQRTETFDTFSVGFGAEGKALDESADAAFLADYLGTRHHHVLYDGSDFAATFDHFIAHLDQPSTDGFNSFIVSQATQGHVQVALSGLGGDELFLGYRYHRELARLQQLATQSPAQYFLPALSYAVHHNSFLQKVAYHSNMNFLQWWPAYTKHEGYLAAREFLSREFIQKLLQKNIEPTRISSDLAALFAGEPDLLNAYSKAELAFYTPGTLLRDADVTGMAFTLEVRFPFLDIPLMQEVVTLPSRYKIDPRGTQPKPLLQAALKNILPAACFSRPKRGFEMPVGFWLRKHGRHLYKKLREKTIFEPQIIDQLIKKFEQKPQEYLGLWSCVVFAAWLQRNQLEFE